MPDTDPKWQDQHVPGTGLSETDTGKLLVGGAVIAALMVAFVSVLVIAGLALKGMGV